MMTGLDTSNSTLAAAWKQKKKKEETNVSWSSSMTNLVASGKTMVEWNPLLAPWLPRPAVAQITGKIDVGATNDSEDPPRIV
jgi:hypothetical protein